MKNFLPSSTKENFHVPDLRILFFQKLFPGGTIRADLGNWAGSRTDPGQKSRNPGLSVYAYGA